MEADRGRILLSCRSCGRRSRVLSQCQPFVQSLRMVFLTAVETRPGTGNCGVNRAAGTRPSRDSPAPLKEEKESNGCQPDFLSTARTALCREIIRTQWAPRSRKHSIEDSQPEQERRTHGEGEREGGSSSSWDSGQRTRFESSPLLLSSFAVAASNGV